MKIQRMLVIKVHAFLACFFIPLATLYFISGALYSLDIKGRIDKQVFALPLQQPFTPDLALLSEAAYRAVLEHGLKAPGGEPLIARKKGSYEYRWGDLHRLLVIHPTADPLQAELVYRQRNPLAQVMRIHRAEEGWPIVALSVSMALALLAILASGVYLALGIPRLRRPALFALGAGILALLPVFI